MLNNFYGLILLGIYLLPLLVFLFFVYDSVRYKGNRYLRVALITIFSAFSVLYILFLRFTVREFIPLIYEKIFSCSETDKTFEYAGCSVKYRSIIETDRCYPCGGLHPCIDGFENNNQIEMLDCLCNKGDLNNAVKFRDTYLKDEYYDVCKDKPKTIYYR